MAYMKRLPEQAGRGLRSRASAALVSVAEIVTLAPGIRLLCLCVSLPLSLSPSLPLSLFKYLHIHIYIYMDIDMYTHMWPVRVRMQDIPVFWKANVAEFLLLEVMVRKNPKFMSRVWLLGHVGVSRNECHPI